MNTELQFQIAQCLYREAYLLDHKKYREWLDLLSDDLVYRMPVRATTEETKGTTNIVDDMTYFEETKNSMTLRVERFYTSTAWVENPAPRQRHFVSNIMITPGENQDEYHVRSYFLFKRSRASDLETEEITGEREDIIRKHKEQWIIAKRTIYPDRSVIKAMNLSMFL